MRGGEREIERESSADSTSVWQLDLNDTVAFVQKHFSSTPTASDAFAQAAVKTASWAREVLR